MATQTIQLRGKNDKATGSEEAWVVNAVNLDASRFPSLGKAKAKRKGAEVEVPQIPLYGSNVSAKQFTTLDDARQDAGDRFDAKVLELVNSNFATLAEKSARAFVKGMLDYDGSTITFDGTNVDGWSVEAEKEAKTGRMSNKAVAAQALERADAIEDPAERIRQLQAALAAIAGSGK